MTIREYLTRDDLPFGRACDEALDWLADTSPATVADAVATCPRGAWLLWLAGRACVPRDARISAVRAAVTRAARVCPDAVRAAIPDLAERVQRDMEAA